MVVLIDPGATHNFISRKLIEVLKIPISVMASYRVQLGNGDNISTTGVCQGVRLQLQGIEIIEDFIPLNLGSTDIILGIQWLETLGGTFVNWKTQLLKFRLGGQTMPLKGDSDLDKTLISLKAMLWTIKHEK